MYLLTPGERTMWTKRLKEAEDALHELMLGEKARVFIDQSGERVEFLAANSDKLRAYISQIKVMLGQAVHVTGPYRPLAGRLW